MRLRWVPVAAGTRAAGGRTQSGQAQPARGAGPSHGARLVASAHRLAPPPCPSAGPEAASPRRSRLRLCPRPAPTLGARSAPLCVAGLSWGAGKVRTRSNGGLVPLLLCEVRSAPGERCTAHGRQSHARRILNGVKRQTKCRQASHGAGPRAAPGAARRASETARLAGHPWDRDGGVLHVRRRPLRARLPAGRRQGEGQGRRRREGRRAEKCKRIISNPPRYQVLSVPRSTQILST